MRRKKKLSGVTKIACTLVASLHAIKAWRVATCASLVHWWRQSTWRSGASDSSNPMVPRLITSTDVMFFFILSKYLFPGKYIPQQRLASKSKNQVCMPISGRLHLFLLLTLLQHWQNSRRWHLAALRSRGMLERVFVGGLFNLLGSGILRPIYSTRPANTQSTRLR